MPKNCKGRTHQGVGCELALQHHGIQLLKQSSFCKSLYAELQTMGALHTVKTKTLFLKPTCTIGDVGGMLQEHITGLFTLRAAHSRQRMPQLA